MVTTYRVIAGACALALSGIGVAHADTVSITGFRDGLSAVADLNTPNNISPRAGEYVGLWNGNSFHSVCVDVEHYLSFGNSYSNYTAKTASAYGLSAAQESLLNKLYTNHYAGSRSSNEKAAAFQIAAWEIRYDGGSALNLYDGLFKMGTGGNDNARDQAATWLSSLSGKNSGNWTFTVLDSVGDRLDQTSHQDLLVTMPVPEPSEMALFLAGLGLMGAVARRRQPRI